ncbi:hypothetical protein MTO96_026033 [Rhipicephalus appendiculatus]
MSLTMERRPDNGVVVASKLTQLRAQLSPKKKIHESRHITLDGARVSDEVSRILRLGPKYAVQPAQSRPDLLSMVRDISNLTASSETEHFISSGVDVVTKYKIESVRQPIPLVASYLKANSLCVLNSDKEAGFAVLPVNLYKEKAREALRSIFDNYEIFP